MIDRKSADYILKVAASYPVVTITGPRQSGKTTLVKYLFPRHEYCNLEAEDVLMAAKADPRAFLHHGKSDMIIDEVQRFPELLTFVQEISDLNKRKGQFILTGSHQSELNAAVVESLAGRTGICELLPLSLSELAEHDIDCTDRDQMLFHGFMPRHYDDGLDPVMMYRDYFHTYVQRDVRRLVNVQDLDAFVVFVRLLAGRVGQLLNKESLARDAGISVPTVTKWLNVLEASYIIYRLRPYYNNLGKRQTKSPKIYFTETGLASYLIGIREAGQLFSHPLLGNLFENMVVMEALKQRLNRGEEPDMWFYRNATGTVEVDLLLERDGRLFPLEIKCSSTYSNKMGRHLAEFAAMVPAAEKGFVVYSGRTFEDIAVNFTEVGKWGA